MDSGRGRPRGKSTSVLSQPPKGGVKWVTLFGGNPTLYHMSVWVVPESATSRAQKRQERLSFTKLAFL